MPGEYHFHIRETGDSRHPAVLLLHGFLGDSDDWQEVMFTLSDRYHCLAPDLPGHGRTRIDGPDSSDSSYSIEATAVAVEQLLIKRNLDQINLIGYSMGGRLALYFALTYPHRVRRLILESASPGLADQTERRLRRDHDEQLARRLLTDPLPQFLDEWYTQPLFASLKQDPARFAQILERRLKQNPQGLAASLRFMGTGTQPSLWDRLADCPPALLLVGEHDAKFRQIANRMAASMPAATIEIVPNAGHNVHVEQPDRFIQIVREFLSR